MHEPTMFDDPAPATADIIVLITADQKAMIMNELKRLFVFHGKRMSDEERGMFASELCVSNLPYKAILAGIRELQSVHDESKNKNVVTFWAIKEACQRHAAAEFRAEECEQCGGTGLVTLIRADSEFKGYECVFGCLCSNGDRQLKSAPRMCRWNGLEVQDMIDRAGGRRIRVRFVHWPRNKPRPVID